MKRSRVSALLLSAIGVSLAAVCTLAQAANGKDITRVYVVSVPPAQDLAFHEGVKSWEKCLGKHGYARAIVTYDAETGDLSRYAFLIPYGTWAAMDDHSAAAKACGGTFEAAISPYFATSWSEIMQHAPKQSYDPAGDAASPPYVWVSDYKVKPGAMRAFKGALAKFAEAAAKTHWEGRFDGYDALASGQGGEDFLFVWPNRSWADIGTQAKPSANDMMNHVYGKAAARANYETFVHSIAQQWADVWSLDKGLSYNPPSKRK